MIIMLHPKDISSPARLVFPCPQGSSAPGVPPHSSSHCGRFRVQLLPAKSKPSVNIVNTNGKTKQNGWEVMKVMEKDGERWKNGTQMALTNGWLLQSKQQMIHLGHCVVRSDFLQKPEDNKSVLSSGKGSIDRRLKIWIAAASIHTSTAYPCVVRHVKTPTAMGMAHPSKTHASRPVHHHDPWVPPKFGQAQGALKNDFFSRASNS